MKFKGQGKINICGFEYKKDIADSRIGGGGGPSTQKNHLYPRLTFDLCPGTKVATCDVNTITFEPKFVGRPFFSWG